MLTDGSLYTLKSLECFGGARAGEQGGQSDNDVTESYWLFDFGSRETLKCLKGKELRPMLSSSVQNVWNHVQGPVGNIEYGSYKRQ
jgi:hypothetical protein